MNEKKVWTSVVVLNLINTYICLFESVEFPPKLFFWWFAFLIGSLIIGAVLNYLD